MKYNKEVQKEIDKKIKSNADKEIVLLDKAIPVDVDLKKLENGIAVQNKKTGEIAEFIAENEDEKFILDECWEWFHNPQHVPPNKWDRIGEYLTQLMAYIFETQLKGSENPELVMKLCKEMLESFDDPEISKIFKNIHMDNESE